MGLAEPHCISAKVTLMVSFKPSVVPRSHSAGFSKGASEIGQRGRTCTCGPSVPGRACWLLHYALRGPGLFEEAPGT